MACPSVCHTCQAAHQLHRPSAALPSVTAVPVTVPVMMAYLFVVCQHVFEQLPCIGIYSSTLTLDLQVCGACKHRYADVLAEYHDDDHLVKFEELLEAAVDLDKIPDEYLICASYDAGLQVCASLLTHTANALSTSLHLFTLALTHACTQCTHSHTCSCTRSRTHSSTRLCLQSCIRFHHVSARISTCGSEQTQAFDHITTA